jgi:hypothetical protein
MLAAEGLDHRERVKRLPLNGKHYIGESGAVQAKSPMRSGGSTADNPIPPGVRFDDSNLSGRANKISGLGQNRKGLQSPFSVLPLLFAPPRETGRKKA